MTWHRNMADSKPALTVWLALLLTCVACEDARVDRSPDVRGPVRGTPVLEHDYDAVADAVVSWSLNAGQRAGQSFVVPEGCGNLSAFRVKLVRTGGDGPLLHYRIGSSMGSSDVASGEIRPQAVSRFFERWTGKDFARPVAVKPGQRYYLQIEVDAQEKAEGAYEIFGTASAKVDHPDFNLRYQYLPQWEDGSLEPPSFENPINADYGSRTPRYDGGSAFSGDGKDLPDVDFAFQFSSGESGARPGVEEEERFAFVEDTLLAPMHAESLRKGDAGAKEAGEIEITREWRLAPPAKPGPVADNALADFRRFMATSMETPLAADLKSGTEQALTAARVIVAGTRAELAEAGRDLQAAESFTVQVSPERVVVCGYDERGLMRGLYRLEELMRMRRAPYLRTGMESLAPRYSPRITSTPFYSTLEILKPPDPYTDEFLTRISHYGFDSIWVWAEIFTIGGSDAFPDLNQQVDEHQRNLQRIVERAGRYGIDVYLQLTYHPLPGSFFDSHPDVRGTPSPFRANDGTYVLCTSTPKVREFIEESTANIFQRVPGLRGLIFIVGGEGFVHCHTRRLNCPRCSKRSAQEVIAEIASTLSKGARSVRPGADVVLWPYSASNWWSRGDTTQSKLIPMLPRDVTFMTEFGKEGLVTFGNKTIPAYDYPISYLGPSERFVEQSKLTKQHGLPFWVKCEHAIALETIQTPYIPVYSRWVERFRRINSFDNIKGVFANWMHYGFTPSIAAEIAKAHLWTPAPDGGRLLRSIARREFGAGTEDAAIRAWNHWSDAIGHYPFSGSMAMGPVQKGPAHPLFLDPDYKPLHNRGRQFTNSLSWTTPWGVDVVIAEFEQLVDGWSKGVAAWDEVNAAAPAAYKAAAKREGGVGRALLACFRSTLNVARFYKMRNELKTEKSPDRALKLLDGMEKTAREELENARSVLPVVRADSRIGYANSAGSTSTGVPRGGIYSPGSIEKKIAQVENMLSRELPELRNRVRGQSQ